MQLDKNVYTASVKVLVFAGVCKRSLNVLAQVSGGRVGNAASSDGTFSLSLAFLTLLAFFSHIFFLFFAARSVFLQNSLVFECYFQTSKNMRRSSEDRVGQAH